MIQYQASSMTRELTVRQRLKQTKGNQSPVFWMSWINISLRVLSPAVLDGPSARPSESYESSCLRTNLTSSVPSKSLTARTRVCVAWVSWNTSVLKQIRCHFITHLTCLAECLTATKREHHNPHSRKKTRRLSWSPRTFDSFTETVMKQQKLNKYTHLLIWLQEKPS